MDIKDFEDAIDKARIIEKIYAESKKMQKLGISHTLENRYVKICMEFVKDLATTKKPSEVVHHERKDNGARD